MRLQAFQFPMLAALLASPLVADTIFFTTGNPDGKIAVASRPSSAGKTEIEAADDFLLTSDITLSSASFTGLLTGGVSLSNIGQVRVEIYRVFPLDSNTSRTDGPPTFSTANVPTRVNSPSDVAFADRDAASGNLSFTVSTLSSSFTTINSVQPGGINPKPNQTTGGGGPVTGQEIRFDVTFTTPFDLPADHYFFVPQVEITDPLGNFLWLSVAKPIDAPGTPFVGDLQAWTRDEKLDPDWLRIGTDIVGGTVPPTYNMAFSLSSGNSVPEPSSVILLGSGLLAVVYIGRKRLSS